MGGGKCPGGGDCEPGASCVLNCILESLEMLASVTFSREVTQKGPWPWELLGVSETMSEGGRLMS